jgi:hypothetical protein
MLQGIKQELHTKYWSENTIRRAQRGTEATLRKQRKKSFFVRSEVFTMMMMMMMMMTMMNWVWRRAES